MEVSCIYKGIERADLGYNIMFIRPCQGNIFNKGSHEPLVLSLSLEDEDITTMLFSVSSVPPSEDKKLPELWYNSEWKRKGQGK